MFDEEEITKKDVTPLGRNLEQLSVAELKHYIEELKAEILRAEIDIKNKEDVKNAADSFFKK